MGCLPRSRGRQRGDPHAHVPSSRTHHSGPTRQPASAYATAAAGRSSPLTSGMTRVVTSPTVSIVSVPAQKPRSSSGAAWGCSACAMRARSESGVATGAAGAAAGGAGVGAGAGAEPFPTRAGGNAMNVLM